MKIVLILIIALLSFFFGYSQDTIQTKKVYLVTVIKSKKMGKVVKIIKNKKRVDCGYIIHVTGRVLAAAWGFNERSADESTEAQ